MSIKVTTEKELGKAIKTGEKNIEIVGSLASNSVKIISLGDYAWSLVSIGIGAAIITVLTAEVVTVSAPAIAAVAAPLVGGAISFGGGITVGAATTIVSVSYLGVAATISAISIGVAAGGINALSQLRDYEISEQGNNRILIKKK